MTSERGVNGAPGRRTDKAGTYRWYNEHALPETLGGAKITVRLHGDDQDTKRKLNRTENLRPIPPSDPEFADLFRRRNDAQGPPAGRGPG